MRVAITGASGLVGSALVRLLRSQGHEILVFTRPGGTPPEGCGLIPWDPVSGKLDPENLRGVDGIVNLAGHNVGASRWSAGVKALIWNSRVDSTRLLVQAIRSVSPPPQVLVSASAIGYYGDTGNHSVTEQSPPADTFLAKLCVAWEGEALAARESGVRVVIPRIGFVLSAAGGGLARMLPIFRLGLGGPVGMRQVWVSWISRDDLAALLVWMLTNPDADGVYNAVAPEVVTNLDFARTLGRVLRRPALFPVPGAMLKLLFGEMAKEVLLTSARVLPARLETAAFPYRYPQLEPALARAVEDT